MKTLQNYRLQKEFRIGNTVWNKMVIESLTPLANTGIEKFAFYGKSITENDYSFLADMPSLKQFDFAANMLTTEQVAWIVSNFPKLDGFYLKAKRDFEFYDSSMNKVWGTQIIGKRKPSMSIQENEKQIEKYVRNFDLLKEKYKGIAYKQAFSD